MVPNQPKPLRLRGSHFATSEKVDIVIEGERIRSIVTAADDAVDLEAGWIAPALFDLQINGCDGRSFNSPSLTVDDVRHVVAACHRHGIAGFCPTLITNSLEALLHGFSTIRRACDADSLVARAVPGLHLEGPYISPEDGPRGAHPLRYVRPPDWDEFRRWQDASGDRIRLVTLAPEHNKAIEFIEKLADSGVVVALGHTAARPECIRAAVTAGARLSTHLGNGCHAVLPRHDNYVWEQLANDQLWASVIADGHHLPTAILRCILRAKTPGRTILTCDASSLAGLPPGRYREWDQELEVMADGRVVVPGTPFLAGSGVFTDMCVARMLSLQESSLGEVIAMASSRPRELLGLEPQPLLPGEVADLILFDWEPGKVFELKATIIAGRLVEGYDGAG
jgi:N-acetylglucosamine-6-phosphate deacetylase